MEAKHFSNRLNASQQLSLFLNQMSSTKLIMSLCDYVIRNRPKRYHPDQLKTLQIVTRSVQHLLSYTLNQADLIILLVFLVSVLWGVGEAGSSL